MLVTTLLLAAALLAAGWATTIRLVPPGCWVAVIRRGVVRRVRRRGLVWRVPFVERFEQDADVPLELPLFVRTTTRDGVPVLVLAEATIALPRPAVGTAYADPWPAAERAAEAAIARSAAEWSVAELTQTAASTTRPLRRLVDDAVDDLGIQVADLALVEVSVPLHGPR